MLKDLTFEQYSAITDFKLEFTIRAVKVLDQIDKSKTPATDMLDILHSVYEEYENVLNVSQRLMAEDMEREFHKDFTKPIKELLSECSTTNR